MSPCLHHFLRDLVGDGDKTVTFEFDNASSSTFSPPPSSSSVNSSLSANLMSPMIISSGSDHSRFSNISMDDASTTSTGSSRWESIPVAAPKADLPTESNIPKAHMVPRRPRRQLSKR